MEPLENNQIVGNTIMFMTVTSKQILSEGAKDPMSVKFFVEFLDSFGHFSLFFAGLISLPVY